MVTMEKTYLLTYMYCEITYLFLHYFMKKYLKLHNSKLLHKYQSDFSIASYQIFVKLRVNWYRYYLLDIALEVNLFTSFTEIL